MKEPILDDGAIKEQAELKKKKQLKILSGVLLLIGVITGIVYFNYSQKKIQEEELLEEQFEELDSLALEVQKAIQWLDSLPDKTTFDTSQTTQ